MGERPLGAAPCSAVVLPYGGTHKLRPVGADVKGGSCPINYKCIEGLFPTFGMWESGGIYYIKVVLDPDNPNCVTMIVPLESVAEHENRPPSRDKFGYLGYVINGMFFYAKEITFGESGEKFWVNRAKLFTFGSTEVENITVVREDMMRVNVKPQFSEEGAKHIKHASKASVLGVHNFSPNVV